MTLVPGQTLAHYEVLGPLGAGAMGEVWRARDTRLGREVAVKPDIDGPSGFMFLDSDTTTSGPIGIVLGWQELLRED